MTVFSRTKQLEVFEALGALKALCVSELPTAASLRGRPEFAALLKVDMPLKHGGLGLTLPEICDVYRRVGQVSLRLRDLPGAGHAGLLLPVANAECASSLIDKAVRGEAFFAIAITEENAGSDMRGITSLARVTSGEYIISARKSFVGRIREATHVIVFCKVDRPGRENDLTAFMVPADVEGLSVYPCKSDAFSDTSWSSISLENVKVPLSFRIGGEGQGFTLFMDHFVKWRLFMAACAIGVAQTSLDEASNWLRERFAFGGPIGRLSHFQQELAELIAHVRMAWLLVLDTAQRIQAKTTSYFDSAMSKSEAVEIALRAAQWSLSVKGAAGLLATDQCLQRVNDLFALRVADGTTEVLRGQVARSLLGDTIYEQGLGRNRKGNSGGKRYRRYWD